MAIVIEDSQIEHLAQQIAFNKGITIVDVLRESLFSLVNQSELHAVKIPLRERLAALAREVDAVPPRLSADTRSDDEILGYNENGIW